MESLAEFKRRIKVGVKLKTIHHKTVLGRDKRNEIIFGDKEFPIREVSIVQTNSFALKTIKTNGEIVDSWCDFPTRTKCNLIQDGIEIFWGEGEKREKILTYKFV